VGEGGRRRRAKAAGGGRSGRGRWAKADGGPEGEVAGEGGGEGAGEGGGREAKAAAGDCVGGGRRRRRATAWEAGFGVFSLALGTSLFEPGFEARILEPLKDQTAI
jgi:hypothetical protein